MQVTQNIKLNIYQTSEYLHVSAKQADDNSRFLRITFTDGKNDLPVPSSAIVSLRALKPDKTSILDSGVVNEDGTVTVELTDQVLAVEGIVRADVMTSQGGEILSTATFLIRVGAVPIGTEVVSSNEFLQLVELYEEISELMPVDTDNIVDGAVTTPKLADDAVTSVKIADGAVGTDNLADGAVTNAKIAEGTITGNKFVPALPITEVKATTSGAKYEQSVTTKLGVTHTALLVTSDHYQNALGAVAFSTTATYAVGDYVVYNKKIYKCINAHSGAWADADFEETKVLPRLDDVEENVTTINSELTAITEGTTAVGTAEQLLSNKYNTDTEPYHFRRTPYDATREMPVIVGGSLGWNQLVKNGNFADGTTYWNGYGTSISASGGKLSVTITEADSHNIYQSGVTGINGHKYLVRATVKNLSESNATVSMRFGSNVTITNRAVNAGTTSTINIIGRCTAVPNPTGYLYLYFLNASVGDVFEISEINIIDLNVAFNSTIAEYIYTIETATTGAGVAWVNRYIDLSKYHTYDAGSIQSVSGLVSHEMTGFNQFDPESALIGTVSGSKWEIPPTASLTKAIDMDFLANTVYCFSGKSKQSVASKNSRLVIQYTDETYTNVFASNSTDELTFTTLSTSGKTIDKIIYTYGNAGGSVTVTDLCINISDETKNGTYEPYQKHTYALDPTVTLRGVPKLVDGKLEFDGDVWHPNGQINRKFNVGTITANDVSLDEDRYTSIRYVKVLPPSDGLKTLVKQGIIQEYGVGIVATSTAPFDSATHIGEVVTNAQASHYWVGFSKDVTLEQAQTALTGLTIIYETATPTTETAEPYTAMQICDGYGTEEFVTDSVVPVGHTTKYPINQVAKLDGLPSDFSTLIAPTEKTYKATRNYTTGSLLIVDNILYKATANIANGGTITPNTNVVATTLSEVIASLA